MIPSIVEDVPIPIERIPRHQGTDYAYVKALAERGRLRLLHRPGPGAGRQQGVLGAGDPRRRAAAGARTPALDGPHDNVTSLRFTFDKEKKELPVVFIQEPYSKAPIPIPIPDITPLNPPLGVVPPLPPKITFLKDTAKLNPLAAVMQGHRLRRPALRLGLRHRPARRRPLRPRAAVARSSSACAARATPFDGLHYVTSVTHHAQARRVHAVVRARPQRPPLDRPGGAHMTDIDTPRRRCSGTTASTAAPCVNNVDPMQIGRIQVIVPDVSRSIPTLVGDAVLPGARHPERGLHRAADRRRGLGRVRAGRPRLPDLGRRLLLAGRRAGDGPRRCRRAVSGFTFQTTLQNGITISDTPGPTGGILIKTTTGAMISVSDVGIVISNGKGATITHGRPRGRHQRRRADGDLRRCRMPGPIVHLGAVVICSHGGPATPTAPFPRVLVSGPAGRDARDAVRRRRLRADRHADPAVRHRAVARRARCGCSPAGCRSRSQTGASVTVPTGTPMLPRSRAAEGGAT